MSIVGRTRPPDESEPSGIRSWTADVADLPRLEATLADMVSAQGPLSAAVLLQRYRGGGDDWAGEFATSLTATRTVIEWAGEHFEDRGCGKALVVVGSIAGGLVASEQPVSYHIAKAAMSQMVRYYAVSLGRKGIRVNAICPGTIVKEESKPFYAEHPEVEALYREIVPLGRMGTSEDVADLSAVPPERSRLVSHRSEHRARRRRVASIARVAVAAPVGREVAMMAREMERHARPPVVHRTTCRMCDSTDLSVVLELEPTPPGDHYVTAECAGGAAAGVSDDAGDVRALRPCAAARRRGPGNSVPRLHLQHLDLARARPPLRSLRGVGARARRAAVRFDS